MPNEEQIKELIQGIDNFYDRLILNKEDRKDNKFNPRWAKVLTLMKKVCDDYRAGKLNEKEFLEEMRYASGEKMISTKEFNDILMWHFKMGKETIQKQGNFEPMLEVTFDYEKKEYDKPEKDRKRTKALAMVVAEQFNDSESRQRLMLGMGAKFKDEGYPMPVAVFMISEAWMSMGSTKKGEGMSLKKDKDGNILRPSEQPLKMECLVIQGMTIDGRGCFASVPFKRVGKKQNVVFFVGDEFINKYSRKGKGKHNEMILLRNFFAGYHLAGNIPRGTGGWQYKDMSDVFRKN